MDHGFYKQIMDTSPIGYAYYKIMYDEGGNPFDCRYLDVNPAFEELTGLNRKEVIGKTAVKIFPMIFQKELQGVKGFKENALTGKEVTFEEYCEPLKRWYRIHAFSPRENFLVTTFVDITKEKEQIEDLKKVVTISEDYLEDQRGMDFQKITDTMKKLSESAIASLNIYDDSGVTYKTVALSGDPKVISKGMEILGMSLEGKVWKHDPVRAKMIENQVITRFNSMSNLTGKGFLPGAIKELLKTFDFGETIIIKITKKSRMIGDFTLVMKKGKVFDKDVICEIYAKQLGLALEMKSWEKKLINSRQEYKSLVENAPGVVYRCENTRKWTMLMVSNVIEEITGYSSKELLGDQERTYESIIHREDVDRVFKDIQRALSSGESWSIEYRIIHKDGRVLWVYEKGRGIKNEQGVFQYLEGIILNITERKRLEKEEYKYKKLTYKSFDVISVLSSEGIILYESDSTKRTFGYEPEKRVGKNSFEFVHEEDQAMVFREFREILAHPEKEKKLEFRFLHNDGSWVWIESVGQNFLKDPDIQGIIVNSRDITHRKEMERKIMEERERFKTTLLSVGEGVVSTDVYGNVLILNPVAEKLTGWSKEEALGKSIEEIFYIVDGKTGEISENPLRRLLNTGEVVALGENTLLISKDGIERPVEDSAASIRDEEGNITGAVLVFSDVTEKKKSRDEIEYLSFYDHLTGVYNRRFFEAEMKRLDKKSNLPITVVMGDVNGLKLINDTFGHSVGDELLVKAAKVVKSCLGKDDIFARVGGDESAIILLKTDASEAKRLVEGIQKELKKEKIRGIDLSISFGWETKTREDQSLSLVLKKAEDLMYNNKLFESPGISAQVIESMVSGIHEKSLREKVHSQRVSELCVALGRALDLEEKEINELKILGLFHDIGKIAVSDELLNKRGKLTEKEYKEICRHAEIGYRILRTAQGMSRTAEHVLFHHERWDGKGYPKGLKGEKIPLFSRICCLADAYEAMTSDRSYRPAGTKDYGIQELKENAGTQFDPVLVKIFIDKVLPNF